jgi:hypothetical protein
MPTLHTGLTAAPVSRSPPLVGRKPCERCEQLAVWRLVLFRARRVLGQLRLPAEAPGSRRVDRAVHDDPVEPGPEGPAAVEAVEAPDRGEEGLLGDVLRERGILDDQVRRAVSSRPVLVEERLHVGHGAALRASHPGALVPACACHRRTIRPDDRERSMPEVRPAAAQRSRTS